MKPELPVIKTLSTTSASHYPCVHPTILLHDSGSTPAYKQRSCSLRPGKRQRAIIEHPQHTLCDGLRRKTVDKLCRLIREDLSMLVNIRDHQRAATRRGFDHGIRR